jgi:cytochrome c peroxidase
MPSRRASLIVVGATFVAVLGGSLVPVRTQAQLSALPTSPVAPADNPTTPEKVALGRLLFWDPILSGPKDVACATCHLPDAGYAENRDLSIGVNGVGAGALRQFAPDNTIPLVKRNSQAVLNAAFNGIDASGHYDSAASPMFWDGRARSLETQALEPIKALEEMRGETYAADQALDQVIARLAAIPDYRARFARAFGGANAVTPVNLGRALAAFERTLVAANSPFDRYMRGDATAMTPRQVAGMERFTRIGCANCHSGPMFTDFKMHVLGVPDNPKLAETDAGVSGTYAFRTASLRNLSLTGPYMHNGVFTSLDRVIRFYDDVRRGGGRGGRGGGGRGQGNQARNPNVAAGDLDPLLRRLNVNGNRGDLVAFLEALTDTSFDRTVPASVPSGLPVGGRIR